MNRKSCANSSFRHSAHSESRTMSNTTRSFDSADLPFSFIFVGIADFPVSAANGPTCHLRSQPVYDCACVAPMSCRNPGAAAVGTPAARQECDCLTHARSEPCRKACGGMFFHRLYARLKALGSE